MIRLFCRHEWKEISNYIFPSAWEQFFSRETDKVTNIPPWIFVKKLIIILACSKCGKLDKIIEECPPDTSGDRTVFHGFAVGDSSD